MWNTYIASLIPYPAHIAPPTKEHREMILTSYRLALRHENAKWCPVALLSGLGVLFGVGNAPRCPVSATLAVGLNAYLSRQFWGPAVFVPSLRAELV